MNEQRKDTRKKLMSFTTVYDSVSHTLIGYVGNINLLGVMVVGEHPVEVGKETILHIELPTSTENIDNKLVMPVRAAWCKQEESAHSYTIGFEFKEITPTQAVTIQAVLDRYHFRYNE